MPSMLERIKRRHTAIQYTDKAPSDANIKKVLEAGRWAPSAGNLQPWYFIVIKDRQRIASIMRTCNLYKEHDNPPVIVAVVLDEDIWVQARRRGPIGGRLGTVESLVCTGTCLMAMALEAQDLGISSSILTPTEDKMKELLDLRRNDFCSVILCLGYEPTKANPLHRTRKPLRSMIYAERYGRYLR